MGNLLIKLFCLYPKKSIISNNKSTNSTNSTNGTNGNNKKNNNNSVVVTEVPFPPFYM